MLASDPAVARGRAAEDWMESANWVSRCLVGTQQGDGLGDISGRSGGLRLRLPADIGASAKLGDGAHVGLVLVHAGHDALVIGSNVFETGGCGGSLRAQFRDVEAEGCGEDAGALTGFQRADGVFEFLDHVTGGELSEIAAITFAIGVALGHFGEGGTGLQFSQGGFDSCTRFRLLAAAVDVLDDMRGMEGLCLAEVLAVGVVECLDFLGAGLCGAGNHLLRGALYAELPLDPLSDGAVLESAAAIPRGSHTAD